MKDTPATTDQSIIVADDDAPFANRLAEALRKRGFDARVAETTQEARRMVREDAPAYAVCDLRLGDGTGLDIIDELSQRRPDARAIILTGYGDTPTAVAAIKLGAVDYLAKPATADEIVATLMAGEHGAAALPEELTRPDDARLDHIARIYADVNGNVSEAARQLGMHRRTLQRILQRARAEGHPGI